MVEGRRRWIVLAALLAALLLGGAPAASAAARDGGPPSVVRADLITHVFPEIGHRVVAVALRYDRPVRVRAGSAAARAAFGVTATLDGVAAPRTVTDVYSSSEPPDDAGRPRPGTGRYLVLELDPADANASVNYNDRRRRERALRAGRRLPRRADRGGPRRARRHAAGGAVRDRERRGRGARRRRLRAPLVHRRRRDAARLPALPAGAPRRGRSYPLVLFLHGGGETGSPLATPANVVQITANRGAIVWATPERQAEHPGVRRRAAAPGAHVAVDRAGDRGGGPGDRSSGSGTRYPIDRDRIYLTGLSRGGRGAVDLLSRNPGRSRAPCSPPPARRTTTSRWCRRWRPSRSGSPTPPTTRSSRTRAAWTSRTRSRPRARPSPAASGRATTRAVPRRTAPPRRRPARLLARARRARSHTLFTTYTAGTVAVNAHFSWGPMYETDAMLDWLFDQER